MDDSKENKGAKMVVNIKPEFQKYEEHILQNPNSLMPWVNYISHMRKQKLKWRKIVVLYERAIQVFPRSYKLWYEYLRFWRKHIFRKGPLNPAYGELCDAYERCLVQLPKMPRIWIQYCTIMTQRQLVTETRRVFDRALKTLPVTQHMRIWPLYIQFIEGHDIPDTGIRVFKRYMKINPQGREEFIDYLMKYQQFDEAALQITALIQEDRAFTEQGKTVHQLWADLCNIISEHPNKIRSFDVEDVIRNGIFRYSDQVASLWCALAASFVRQGQFERARDIYEEGMEKVTTVRDFAQIFNAYTALEDSQIKSYSTNLEEKGASEEEWNELFWMMERYEHLLSRRPLLVNSVMLRQNPHNTHEWLNRVQLYEGHKDATHKQLETFQAAVKRIDAKKQIGRLSDVWIAFAKFYETHGQLADACRIFEIAVKVPLRKVDELANVWCEYAELQLRKKDVNAAFAVLRRACAQPPSRPDFFDENEPVQNRVYKSLRLWTFYVDLTESIGTFTQTKEVYSRILDLGIPTPQIVINYAKFLEEHEYFENAFQVYSRAVTMFRWPHVKDIWNVYLVKFMKRYGEKKIERARDLFEECLESCPANCSKNVFLLYAKLEEEYGLARHAMGIYNRACEAVDKEDKAAMFNIYLKKATDIYGVTSTRPIYERAIEMLPEKKSREFSVRYANMERALGEIDRARAIYTHCAEVCDPRVYSQFWDQWREFELKHGNEDTMRELMRIKRSIMTAYDVQDTAIAAQAMAVAGTQKGEMGTFELLDKKAREMASDLHGTGTVQFVRGESKVHVASTTHNPEEIAVDDDDDDDDESEDEPEIREVPETVFGELAAAPEE
ncbi:unnamed protein product, partial [Mesorhabditis belari]|uniref:Pre-mRNA-splicing factor SYF1 n=1 Tax=Mesorhabditis belari TaxID=2138241 RepID=A0AAF3F289_9BILA